jgi:RNA polymerase subunit RPABC4/transcription elongation factor Spt4
MKRPHFFCESCGMEVRKDARMCPRCGRFFSSVKCPKCGHVGEADDFSLGCPICGYALSANPSPEPIKPLPQPAPPIPWWAYLAAACVILALSIALLRALS